MVRYRKILEVTLIQYPYRRDGKVHLVLFFWKLH